MDVHGIAAVAGFEATMEFQATIPNAYAQQGMNLTHNHDGDFLFDTNGIPLGGNSPKERIEVKAILVPVAKGGALISEAERSSLHLPAYTWVHLKNMHPVTSPASPTFGYNGVYIYQKGFQIDFSEGYAKIDLPLVRFLKLTDEQHKAICTKRTL